MWINDASYSFPQQTGSENGVGGIGIIDLVSPFTNQACQSGGGTLTNYKIYLPVIQLIKSDYIIMDNAKVTNIKTI